MRSLGSLALGLLPVVLVGCAFVSSSELGDLKEDLDADGDGSSFKVDCDDLDPLRFPNPGGCEPDATFTRFDIPYNHIDDDCGCSDGDDRDLVDVDGDGFAGVSFELYAAEHMALTGITNIDDVPWAVTEKVRVDCLDDDGLITLPAGITAADVNPSVLLDAPYDGVDQDCSGNNDYDDDGDGQMPPTVGGTDIRPAVEAYSAAWNIPIDVDDPNAFGDCNDVDAAVNRNTANVDVAYDGIDSNCNGDNDFDADGDGYYPTEYSSQGGGSQFINFVAAYHPSTAPDGPATWAPPGLTRAEAGDCLDQPHPGIPDLSADTVHPAAIDDPYDGIDSDCDGLNDFDADGDGYILDADLVPFSDFVVNWTGTEPGFPNTVTETDADGGDCDDTNATVAPGNLELLFDTNDADCDANVDATPFGFSGFTWDTPTWPRIVRTDAHYLIGTTARWADVLVAQREEAALALVFAPDAGYKPPVLDPLVWNNVGAGNVFVHGAGFDMVGRPNAFWVSASYFQPDPNGGLSDNTRLLVREHTYDAITGNYVPQIANRVFGWTGHDVGVDLQLRQDADGENVLWAMACGGAEREYPDLAPQQGEQASFRSFVQNAPVSSSFPSQETRIQRQQMTTNTSAACFQEVSDDGNTALLTSCDETGCESYDATLGVLPALGPIAPSADATWNNTLVREANVNEDLLIIVKVGGGVTVKDLTTDLDYDLLAGETVISADAGRRDGRLYVAAIVDEGGPANLIKLIYTDNPGVTTPIEIALPLVDNDLRYEHTPVGGCDTNVPGCEFGRNLNPYKIGMFVDDDLDPSDDRLVVAVSAKSLDTPTLPRDALNAPYPQDAVGWVFLGFADP
jgi:hypothetical protein